MNKPEGKSVRFSADSQDYFPPIEDYENIPLVSLESAVEPLRTFLPSIQIYVHLAKHKCSNPAQDLTSDQSAAIMLCTMRWQPLDQCLSFVLNAILRSSNYENLQPWSLYLKLLFTALHSLPTMDRLVYRGIQFDDRQRYPKGQKILWRDLTLCTTSIDQLYSKQNLTKTTPRTILTIQCYSSKDIRKHSFDPSLEFILLLPARHFQVMECNEEKGNIYSIQLKEIPPNNPNVSQTSSEIKMKNFFREKFSSNFITFDIKQSSHIDEDKLDQIISKYPLNSSIQLRIKQISNTDMKIIVQQAIVKKQCTELWLYNAQMTAQGALILSNGLFHNSTLRKLNLNDNTIHDRGVYVLCRVLAENNSTLKELYLARNGITSKGAEYLAEMFNTNRTLTILSLYGNRIDDHGIKCLTHVLKYYNTTLENLYLSGNKLMTDISIDYLVDMLKNNQTLKEVHLFNCNLSELGKRKLREMTRTKKEFTLNI